jgi:peptide/nickel transport system substrate-binding protein
VGTRNLSPWSIAVVVTVAVLAVACAGAAPDTPVPDQATTSAATPTSATVAPATSAGSTPPPTAAPAVTPMSPSVASAKDSITLVVGEEPQNLNSHLTIGGSVYASITRANMVDPLTWQSGDDLRIVPTSATESWEQLAPDKWRFQLRQGVKFHNGEQWNAQAALPSLAYLGIAANDNPSYQYTGSYTGEAVDEYTLDITCDEACPIFPKTTFFVMFEAPNFLATTPEEEVVRQSVGFGPYKLVKWDAGVSITQEAYDDYVPVGDHFEFQKPRIRNIKWLWRGEPTVMASMVKVGEADMAWDVGVDAIKALNKDQIKTGTSAETFAMTVNTIWHPELKKKPVREAIVHAINCQEMIDTLYAGQTTCRGNIIWPGITGATERNTAPYEYNPELSKQLLAEANYDPNNLIRITGRSTRIPKQVEVYEAIQGYLEEVGMNVEINIVEPSVRSAMTRCGMGQAVAEVLEAKGKAVDTAQATMEEYQAAVDKGGANCPTGDLIENEPSNETLDFGRQVNNYMSCYAPNSLVCDTSPGGIQEQIGPALAASGEERQRLMTALADKMHDDVLFIPGFDLPVVFAVDPRLNWQPRPDPVIRVSTMWFSP